MFHNEILNELLAAFPASNEKAKFTMLVGLLNGLYDHDLDRDGYVDDLRAFLGIDIEGEYDE